MNNKNQFSVTANTSAVQFWVYCVYSEVVTFEFLSIFVNPKLANRDFQISVMDILYPWRMVQIIRVDDLIRRKPLPTTYKCMCPTWEPNYWPLAKETAGTRSCHSANELVWKSAFACHHYIMACYDKNVS